MNKTLQDYVWSILPKEFKEEVKRLWSVEVDCATKYHSELHKHRVDLLYELFGEHLHWQNSLTSNEEGEEEFLTVQRSKVIDIFTQNTVLLSEGHSEYLSGYYNGKCHVLKDLFSSKCLPDELREVIFAKSEPKFHKGDKVEVINYDFGLPSLSRCVHEIFTVSDVKYNANQWMYKLETNKWLFNERDYLESIQWCEHFLKAYKEPQPAESTNEGTRQEQCVSNNAESGTHSFNHNLKDDFHDHNRLHIAPVAINSHQEMVDMKIDKVAELAIETADTLIAECEEAIMTKYYFMSYIFDDNDGKHMASCTCKAENPTLKGLRNLIAKYNDADAETVVIISIKDLTKKEYEMLNNDNDD